MSRTDYLTIGIVAVCLVALFYLIYQFANLGQKEKPLPETQEAPADNYPATDDLYNPETADTSFTDEEPYPDESYPGPETTTTTGQDKTQTTDARKSTDKPAPSTAKPVPAPQPVTTTTEPSPASYGDYLVLAGSFKYKSNAETEVRKLKKMGYSNAEVALFNRGAYASALVDRFDNYADANALVKELKGKGVDALVQKKRPQ